MSAVFSEEPALPAWSDRDAVIDYLVEAERTVTGSAEFDEARWRDVSARSFDRTVAIEASASNHFMIDPGSPWRDRLSELALPTLVLHGTDDPMFPYAHGAALAREIPGATLLPMPGAGHEPPPPRLWDEVVPALLTHTARTAGTASPGGSSRRS